MSTEKEGLYKELYKRKSAEALQKIEKYPNLYWAKRYHKNNRGEDMDFTKMYYLIELYKNMHLYPQMVVEKSVQCFVPDTMIWCERGQKEIKYIVIGDKVWTHRGRLRAVTSVMRRAVDEDLIIQQGWGTRAITSTQDHPFYEGGDTFALASQTRVLVTPQLHHEEKVVATFSLLSYFKAPLIEGECFRIKSAQYVLPCKIVATPEFYRIVGYFLGEGFVREKTHDKRVSFSFHKDEVEIAADCIGCMKKVFRIEGSSYIYGNTHLVIYHGELLSTVFRKLFGDVNSFTKVIPCGLWPPSHEAVVHLLEALIYADGHVSKDQVRFGTVSQAMALQVEILLNFVGVKSTLSSEIVWSGSTAYHILVSGEEARRLCSLFPLRLKGVVEQKEGNTRIKRTDEGWEGRVRKRERTRYKGFV
jgi:hypothetical protein